MNHRQNHHPASITVESGNRASSSRKNGLGNPDDRATTLLPMGRTGCQRSGGWAEQRALRLLRERGWQLQDRNWRCRWGELDLVLAKPKRLLLVEVKGRRRAGPDGHGLGALGPLKRRRLARCGNCWLAEHPEWGDASVEVVAALVPLPPARGTVRWVRLLG